MASLRHLRKTSGSAFSVSGIMPDEQISVRHDNSRNDQCAADVAVPAVKVTPVAEVKPQPVIAEPTKANEEVNLEDKILQYINNHSQGVKVSDMEEPLHETRMKIGFAAKCLLDAGKVSKVENLYYPIKKTF